MGTQLRGSGTISLLPPATEDGVIYDLLQCRVPGGDGFTLWIDRSAHHIDRIVRGDSVTFFQRFSPHGEWPHPTVSQSKRERARTPWSSPRRNSPRCHKLNEADFKPPFHTDYTMPASKQVTVPAEGGLIFKMKINGQDRPFRTVFDTGAVNVVSTTFAKRLGLKVEETPVNVGAIGGAITAHTAHVDTLTIGDLVVRNQTFYVLDIPSDAGDPEMLVGWELMRRLAVRVDFEHEQLHLSRRPALPLRRHRRDFVPLILNKDGNGAEIRAEVDCIPGVFSLDTGNQTGLFLNSGFVQEHDLVVTLGAHYRGYNGKGLGGPSPEAWFARLHTLRIGGLNIANPVVRLQTQPDGPTPTPVTSARAFSIASRLPSIACAGSCTSRRTTTGRRPRSLIAPV